MMDDDGRFVDPFELPPDAEVVSSRLETRGEEPSTANQGSWKIWHFLTGSEYAKLKWHAEKRQKCQHEASMPGM